MAKEILIYGPLYDSTVAPFIRTMEENKGSDIVLRINSPGGEVNSAYGAIAKYREHTGKKIIKVDGQAASAAAYFCCYTEDVECLDVSTFLFHRAAYPSWFEKDRNYFTDQLKEGLIRTNKDLRAAMEGKFTAAKWREVTGTTLDELFSLEQRLDVSLTASQAKELGLVSRVAKLTPERKSQIESMYVQMAAMTVCVLEQQGAGDSNIEAFRANYEKLRRGDDGDNHIAYIGGYPFEAQDVAAPSTMQSLRDAYKGNVYANQLFAIWDKISEGFQLPKNLIEQHLKELGTPGISATKAAELMLGAAKIMSENILIQKTQNSQTFFANVYDKLGLK
jgi:ATP-dependent protease ClpP protease subunit